MSKRILIFLGLFAVCIFLCQTPAVFADDRFTDNGDGTVTDRVLGVMWSKTDNQGDINWKQARQWAKYTFPDTLKNKYDNWRLPTLKELESLYNENPNYKGYETACGQNVRIVSVLKLSCGWAWASDNKSITANVYNFNRGYHYTDRMVHFRAYRALPVRTIE